MNWLWIGVGVSTLALLFSIVWTVVVLARVTSPGAAPALTVEVTGHQQRGKPRRFGFREAIGHDQNFLQAVVPVVMMVEIKLTRDAERCMPF